VIDSGIGIPEHERERVFDAFYQVDSSSTREQGGTGLGLSIVRHILALHGGRVTVESEVGAGSTFRFELPPPVPGSVTAL
jgi:signal transduction histidine kinase